MTPAISIFAGSLFLALNDVSIFYLVKDGVENPVGILVGVWAVSSVGLGLFLGAKS